MSSPALLTAEQMAEIRLDAFGGEHAHVVEHRRALLQHIDALEARIAELEPAAECWDALAKCYRITCQGWAGLGNDIERAPLPTKPGYSHATFSFWTDEPGREEKHVDPQAKLGPLVLSHFISRALANEKARSGEGAAR